MKIRLASILMFILLFSEMNGINKFVPTGGPTSARADSFVFDSLNGTLYVNTLDGIYKLNKTATGWENAFPFLNSSVYPDYYFTLRYADSLIICSYIAGGGDVIWGNGLFVSSDNGLNWKDIGNSGQIFDVVRIGNKYLYGGWDTVKASTDNGQTWFPSYSGISDTTNHSSLVIYQLLKLNYKGKEYLLARSYTSGLFISSDSGNSWSNFLIHLPKDTLYSHIDYSAMVASDSGVVWIACAYGIFYTSDLGASWKISVDGLEKLCYFDIQNLRIDKQNNLYGMDYGLRIISKRSNDSLWRFANTGLSSNSVHDVFRDEKNNVYYATSSDGIIRSTDEMNHWHFFSEGFNRKLIITNVVVAKNKELICITDCGSLFKSSDKGATWISVECDINDKYFNKIFTDYNGNIFCLSIDNSLYFSYDNGESWKLIPTIADLQYLTKIIFDKSNNIFAYAEYKDKNSKSIYGILFSSDSGKSWEIRDLPETYFSDIAVDNNGNLLASNNNAIYKSTDGGKLWNLIYNDSSSFGPSFLYITTNNDIFLTTNNLGLFRSTDDGLTWTNLTGLGSGDEISCLNSPDIPGKIIAGSRDYGYFISGDNGDNWTHCDFKSTGAMTLSQFYNIAYDGQGTMYAATFDGVYKCDDITEVSFEKTICSNLFVKPNPASDYITISVRAQLAVPESIKIFDIFGQEEHPPIPSYEEGELRVDVSSLATGVYFVRVGNKVQKFLKV